jgi:tryptophan synthase alpha subunit
MGLWLSRTNTVLRLILVVHSAFVTFLTAGYPSRASTVPAMLGMERGGADVIELGVPFSDPIADGPAIQEANTVSHLLLEGLGERGC